jgi:phage shock protein A
MPITQLPKDLPSDLEGIKTLIDERVDERQKLEDQKAPIQQSIQKINQEIDELRTEIDVVLKLKERPIKRNPKSGEVIA